MSAKRYLLIFLLLTIAFSVYPIVWHPCEDVVWSTACEVSPVKGVNSTDYLIVGNIFLVNNTLGKIFTTKIFDLDDQNYYLDPSGESVLNAVYASKIGIGTENPQGLLHVSSGISGDAVVIVESDTDNNNEYDNPIVEFRQDGGLTGVNLGFNESGFGPNRFGIGRRYDGVDYWDTFVIDTSNGNVGIGTNAPNARLEVNGSFRVKGPNGKPIFYVGSDAAGQVEFYGNAPYIDFKDNTGHDYDVRIQMKDENNLYIYGGNLNVKDHNIYVQNGYLYTEGVVQNSRGVKVRPDDLLMGFYPDNLLGFRLPYKVERWNGTNWEDVTSSKEWGYLFDGKSSTRLEITDLLYNNDYFKLRFTFDLGGRWVSPVSLLHIIVQHVRYIDEIKVEQADDSSFTTNLEVLADFNSPNTLVWDGVVRIKASKNVDRRYLRITISGHRLEGSSENPIINEILYLGWGYWGGSRLVGSMIPIDWDYKGNINISGDLHVGNSLSVDESFKVGRNLYVGEDIYAHQNIYVDGVVESHGEPYAKATFPLLEDAESSYHSYSYGGGAAISCATYIVKTRYLPAGQLSKSTDCVLLYGVNGYYEGAGGDLIVKIVTPTGTEYSSDNIGLTTSAANYWGEISIPPSDCTNGKYTLKITLCSYYNPISGQTTTSYGKVLTSYLIVR